MFKIDNNGFCRLCGDYGDMSDEHVPPQAAFNDTKYSMYAVSASEESSFIGISQNGMKFPTLCRKCNNFTGGSYGREYKHMATSLHQTLECVPVKPVVQLSNKTIYPVRVLVDLTVDEAYPLRFLKQVATIMHSVNLKATTPPLPDLKNFVLERNNQALPQDYRFFMMGFNDKGNPHRFADVTLDNDPIQSDKPATVYEFCHYPFVFYMMKGFYGNTFQRYGFPIQEITDFCQYGYDHVQSLRLELIVTYSTDFPNLLSQDAIK